MYSHKSFLQYPLIILSLKISFAFILLYPHIFNVVNVGLVNLLINLRPSVVMFVFANLKTLKRGIGFFIRSFKPIFPIGSESNSSCRIFSVLRYFIKFPILLLRLQAVNLKIDNFHEPLLIKKKTCSVRFEFHIYKACILYS